jgi:hypothetical protein
VSALECFPGGGLMVPISIESAQASLSFLHDKFRETVQDAWVKFVSEVLPLFPLCTIRFRRNAMYDLMIQKARPLFQDVDKVSLQETKRGRILLTVRSQYGPIVLRFKKVDQQLKTANYPTQGSLDFDNQQPDLPGIPRGARLTIGYEMNEEETELRGVYVICSTGKTVHWDYPLMQEQGGQLVDVFSISPEGMLGEKRRVRPKEKVADLDTARQKKKRK